MSFDALGDGPACSAGRGAKQQRGEPGAVFRRQGEQRRGEALRGKTGHGYLCANCTGFCSAGNRRLPQLIAVSTIYGRPFESPLGVD